MEKQFFHLSTDVVEQFKKKGLNNFESLWNVAIELVDEPNRKGVGRSEVGVLNLAGRQGQEERFYIKRQLNFNGRILTNPFCSIPIALREWLSIQALNDAGIVTLAVVCCARSKGIDDRAIFVTRALDGYQDFSRWWQQDRTETEHSQALQSIGRMIARLHNAQYRHGCLYPKHIYIASDNPEDIRMIDLEKCRRIFGKRGGVRDLDTLLRRQNFLTEENEQQLLQTYVAEAKANWSFPALQKIVAKRVAKK